MLERCGERIHRVVVAVAIAAVLHEPVVAQIRPWQPIPRFALECSKTVASGELDAVVKSRDPSAPGLALVLLSNGEPLATRYVGVEDLTSRAAIGPDTRFYIASIAKTVTATAALMLAERGALRLDDSLGRWIDGMPACTRGIRVIHLLQHTSGLPDHFDAMKDSIAGLDNPAVVRFVRRLEKLEFEPGTKYAYCNTGYVLLSEVIGRASGRGFAAFVEDSIFAPLGMKSSNVIRRDLHGIPHRATGHRREGERFVPDDVRDLWTMGSGGMYSTLPDLITWYRSVVGGRLLKPSSTELLFQPPITLAGRRSYLAMGWSDETPGPRTPALQGLRAFGSFGDLAGFRSAILFYPDHGLAWIALSNAGEGALPPQGMGERLFRRL